MSLSNWTVFSRSLSCRLPQSAATQQWVRHQSTQQKDDIVPVESLESENVPDVHVNQLGEVYDKERLARDVSRMYPFTRAKMLHVDKMPQQLFEHQKTKIHLRKMYAKYGRASGIDPGVMWPTREEIDRITSAERNLGIPTLQESWTRIAEKRKVVEDRLSKEYEKVDQNMAKMADNIKAFRKRQQQAEDALKAEKIKREKLMEEAKNVLGFHVDPKDKRFQELIEAKEIAAKKQAKQAKKKEKEAREIARLTETETPTST